MKARLAVALLVLLPVFLVFPRTTFGQSASPNGTQSSAAQATDAQGVWRSLARPTFDPSKSAQVTNLELDRDRIRVTLESGGIRFTQPVNGVVTGMVFHGAGKLQVSSPNAIETQQLQRYLKDDAVNLRFSEAVFSFTDNTLQEISSKVQWSPAVGSSDDSYASRMDARENLGFAFLPRLFKNVMATDRSKSSLFLADVKTSDHGWVETLYEADRPEEISVGQYNEISAAYKNFDKWTSFPAGNRNSAEAFAVPFAKADYLVKSYNLDSTVTGGAELTSAAKVNLEERWSGEHVLLFNLDSNLRVDKVSDSDGHSLAFFQARENKDRPQGYGDYVAVVLASPTQEGRNSSLTFHYAGKHVVVQVGTGNYFAESFGWYPSRIPSGGDEFAGRADFDLHFRSPSKYELVATGNKISETTDGNERISEFKSSIPLAVAGFAFGDYKISTEKVGNVDVQVFANKNGDDNLDMIQKFADGDFTGGRPAMFAMGNLSPAAMSGVISQEMGNSIRLFENYFGPYPYAQLAVTNIPYSYGQGWPGLIYLSVVTFLDDTQRHQLGIKDSPRVTEFFRAHETSHQWWGHRVGWKSYHDQWLSEGFAQFSGNLYVQVRDNQKEYVQRLREDRQQLLTRDQHEQLYDSAGPIWLGERDASSLSPNAYNVVIYDKGGYVLTMLRMMMRDSTAQDPDARFKAMMHDFCNTYDNKAASTEDFKAIAEKYMTRTMDMENNHKLDWFFREYVYGTGIPHYEFHADVQSTPDGKFKMVGSFKRTGVPDNWMDVVPVFADDKGKQVPLGLFRVTKSDTEFSIPLNSNPGKLQVNSWEELLAEVKQ
jgi:Peptidase family M1 domain